METTLRYVMYDMICVFNVGPTLVPMPPYVPHDPHGGTLDVILTRSIMFSSQNHVIHAVCLR